MACALLLRRFMPQLTHFTPREAQPIVDCKGRIIAVLAGRPRDPTYVHDVAAAFQSMLLGRAEARFPADISKHRRGPFPALNAGLSYSKGQRVPSRLGGPYAWLLQRLLGDSHINRMAVFASGTYPPPSDETPPDASIHSLLRALGPQST